VEADVRAAVEAVGAKPVAEAPRPVVAKEAVEPPAIPGGELIEKPAELLLAE
jgi:hypothetical protein